MSIRPLDEQKLTDAVKVKMSIGHNEMSIAHTEMSIRPSDKQKCPLDIQMSIRPLDEQKCPVDI